MRKTIITGNISKDIEIKTSAAGSEYGISSVGVYAGKDKDTEWYNLTIPNSLLDYNKDKIKKGNKVLIEGVVSAYVGKGKDGTQVAKLSIIANTIEVTSKAAVVDTEDTPF